MATKVKGEAIKEGSIPMSALATEVKDKIENAGGGADWNAQEGEAGYIKNKLFRFIDCNGNEYKFKNALKETDFTPILNENGETYLYKKQIDAEDLQYVIANKRASYYGVSYDCAFYPCEYKNGKYIFEHGEYSYQFWVETDEDYYNWLYVEPSQSDTFFPNDTIYIIDNYEDVNIEQIPIQYIPKTVLKTTPQSLSTEDKKQALTNLGIADLLEALKPVQLSGDIPVGNVTQKQLDEIGLTEKVINNILNGYTNKISTNGILFHVIYAYNDGDESQFIFISFNFGADGIIESCIQYKYIKYQYELTIEIMEI